MNRTKISLVWDEQEDFIPLIKLMLLYYDCVKISLPFMSLKEDYYNTEKWETLRNNVRPVCESKDGLVYDFVPFFAAFPEDTVISCAVDYLGSDINTELIDKLLNKNYIMDFVSSCIPDVDNPDSEDGLLEYFFMLYSTHWMLYHENQIKRMMEFIYRRENTASLSYDMGKVYNKMAEEEPDISQRCCAVKASEGIILPYFDVPIDLIITARKVLSSEMGETAKIPSFMSGFYPEDYSRLSEFVEVKINSAIKNFNDSENMYVDMLIKELGKPSGYAKLDAVYFSEIGRHANYVWRKKRDFYPSYLARISKKHRRFPIYYNVSLGYQENSVT